MTTTLFQLLMLGAGIVVLGWGGDVLVKASVTIAHRLGVSTLLIGLTVVAFGTSAPELAFNVIASVNGSSGLVFGNVVGSNICNVGLILGVAALLQPLTVHTDLVRREIPFMIGALLVMTGLGYTGLPGGAGAAYSRLDGWLLIVLMGVYGVMSVAIALRQRSQLAGLAHNVEEAKRAELRRPLGPAVVLLVVSLVMLTGGAKLTELGAVGLAKGLGISDAVIGLTVVAVGTSLPELAASIVAARRRQAELAIGNIVGSNIFNALAIFGVSAAIRPVDLPEGAALSLFVMCALSLSLLVLSRTRSGRLSRLEGVVLLGAYGAYIGYQVWQAVVSRSGDASP